MLQGGGPGADFGLEIWEYFLGWFGEIAGEWRSVGVED